MTLLGLVALIVVASTVVGAIGLVQRWRTPEELRGDWWAAFERDFRSYARQANNPRSGRRHRNEGRSAPG